MIDSVKLSQLAEELSNTPCPVCGKCHKVELHVREESDAYMDSIGFLLPNGSCEGFKEHLIHLLATSRHRFTKPLW